MGSGTWPGSIAGQFSSDTIIALPNAASTPVNALEMVTSLTNNGVGVEASKVLIKVLLAGAVVTAQDIRGGQTIFPDGTAAIPSIAFASRTDTGFSYDSSNLGVQINIAGVGAALIDGSRFWHYGGTSQVIFSVAADATVGRHSSGKVMLRGDNGVLIGLPGALATTATAGHIEITTCAGAPTGALSPETGKAGLIYDSTNSKLYVRSGGTWKSTAALT